MNQVRRGFVVAAALAAVTSPWWGPAALRPLTFFGVRRVEVAGARYLAPEAVVRGLGLGPEASVFDDLDALAARVRAMGGVADARVQRRLPATLRVEIREVGPVALAEGPGGLVPVARDGRPLPFDATASPVDAPVVPHADRRLLEALATVQATDLTLYASIAAASLTRGGEVVLELNGGRVRLAMPVEPAVVCAVAAVRSDLVARRLAWRELDGRFSGWVVVRKAPQAPTARRGVGAA